jgi:hypothetical protein
MKHLQLYLAVLSGSLLEAHASWVGYSWKNGTTRYQKVRKRSTEQRLSMNISAIPEQLANPSPIRGPDDSNELLGDLLYGGPYSAVGQVSFRQTCERTLTR